MTHPEPRIRGASACALWLAIFPHRRHPASPIRRTCRDFFKAYKSELRREFGGSQAKQEVYGQARVRHISEYTKQQVLC